MSWKEKAERAAARLKTVSAAARATVDQLVTDVETLGSAALAGGARGHFEGAALKAEKAPTYYVGAKAQISPEAIAGGLLKVLGYSGLGGKGSEHLHALGNGPLASLLSMKARDHFFSTAQGLDPAFVSVGARASHRQIDPGAIRAEIARRRAAANAQR